MDLYEQNYILLRLLAPTLKSMPEDEFVSDVTGCLPVYMQIVSQEKYTTTLMLTYRFENRSFYPKQPDLTIRVYHDAKTAEVMSGFLHGQRRCLRKSRELVTGLQINRFLYKWLRYCLYRGHELVESRMSRSL
ncbi:MAG: DUF1249 domain-containing protein [Pseudomonadota bacterium]